MAEKKDYIANSTFDVPTAALPSETITREQYASLGGISVSRLSKISEVTQHDERNRLRTPPNPLARFTSGSTHTPR